MHTQKYTINGYGDSYMDLNFYNGLEQYTVSIIIIAVVKGRITVALGMVFPRNVSFICMCLSQMYMYLCVYL